MRNWKDFSREEKAIFVDELHYRHMMIKDEIDFLHDLKVKAWIEPLSFEDLRHANEILGFVEQADLSFKQ